MTDENRRPSTGLGSRRYERYEAQGLDLTPDGSAVPTNPNPPGYDEANREERAEAAYKAAIAGVHGHDLTKKELKEEEKRRYYEHTNSGTPLGHKGFSKADRERLIKAAKQDRDRNKK